MMALVRVLLVTLALVTDGILTENENGHCIGESCQDETENGYTQKHRHQFPSYGTNIPRAHSKPGDRDKRISPGTTKLTSEPSHDDAEKDEDRATSFRERAADYEFPVTTRLDPGAVGDVVELELEPGKMYKRVTRSVQPPVFEIEDFLSAEECDFIVGKAIEQGMETSVVFGKDIQQELDSNLNSSEMRRISKTMWLRHEHVSEDWWTPLHHRLSKLTQLPVGMIKRSEPIQVVNYAHAGHIHAHIDSAGDENLPCCFQTRCDEKEDTPEWIECCRICRFVTVLYFLNDVEEGGETAFPLADMPDDMLEEKFVNLKEQSWYNLSKYCHNSSLVVTPKKGKALMWYSHFVDQKGYLGPLDKRSHHGGCDVIKGIKWVANNWICGTTYKDRFTRSIFYH